MPSPATCPACGPLPERYPPLWDEANNRFHCSTIGCDRVVSILTPPERAGSPFGNRTIVRRTSTPAPVGPRPRDPGPQIMRAMLERERLRGEGRASTPREGTVTLVSAGGQRQGTCATCGQVKFLIRKEPPTCTKCWHQTRGTAPVPVPTPAAATAAPPAPAVEHPRPCKIAGCDGRSKYFGMCSLHGQRARRAMDQGLATREEFDRGEKLELVVTERLVARQALASRHAARALENGPTPPAAPGTYPKLCRLGDGRRSWLKGYCTLHGSRAKKLVDAGNATWEALLADPVLAARTLAEAPVRKGTPGKARAGAQDRSPPPGGRATPASMRGTPPEAPRAVVVDAPEADELAREVEAIERCSRVLDGLDPEALPRVLQYVLYRISTRRGVKVAALLPGPKTTRAGD